MFNGVEESYAAALAPLAESLGQQVSARLNLTQLGWVVYDERVHRANCAGVPILLERRPARRAATPSVDRAMAELEALESSVLGLHRRARPRPREATASHGVAAPPPASDLLAGQLAALRAMYDDRCKDSVRENFAYIAYRAGNLMGPHMAPTEFGTTHLAAPEEVERWFLRRQVG